MVAEEVETDDAVGIDVGVHGNGPDWRGLLGEGYLWRFCWGQYRDDKGPGVVGTNRVFLIKLELQAIHLALIDWVRVQDLDIQLPFLEVFCLDQVYPRG